MRSTRPRLVGRSKRKAEVDAEAEADAEGSEEASQPRRQDNERQAKLEQALMQQMEMQKKLHEQLEVAPPPSLPSTPVHEQSVGQGKAGCLVVLTIPLSSESATGGSECDVYPDTEAT